MVMLTLPKDMVKRLLMTNLFMGRMLMLIMQKLGMRFEGRALQALKKWGRYEDLVSYAILREDWPDAIIRHN